MNRPMAVKAWEQNSWRKGCRVGQFLIECCSRVAAGAANELPARTCDILRACCVVTRTITAWYKTSAAQMHAAIMKP
jgi:hypothetical protein